MPALQPASPAAASIDDQASFAGISLKDVASPADRLVRNPPPSAYGINRRDLEQPSQRRQMRSKGIALGHGREHLPGGRLDP